MQSGEPMKASLSLAFTFTSCLSFSADLPEGHPPVEDALAAVGAAQVGQTAQLPNSGTVIDTLGTKSHTYIELDKDGQRIWLAAPRVDLSQGTRISYGKGIPLVNFYSNSLKREFSEITFVERVQVDQ